MQRLPKEWVNRIFERLAYIYKEKWEECYGNENKKNLYLTMWSIGLSGLIVSEIRKALTMCECFPENNPPTVIDFYHYAKGIKVPYKIKSAQPTTPYSNPDIAKKYLDDIRSRLKGKVTHGT